LQRTPLPREPNQSVFGCVISGAVGDPGDPCDRSDIHNAPRTLLEHHLPQSAGQQKGRNQIDVENAAKCFHVDRLCGSNRADPGIVDQNIDAVPARLNRSCDGVNDSLIGNITGEFRSFASAGANTGQS
jgi:hypothetical protein